MISFGTILSATAPVFIVIAVGFLLYRRGWLSEELETGLMRLALNLLVPCLILTTIPGNPALQEVSSAFFTIGAGFVFVVLGFAVAGTIGWVMRFKRGSGLRTFAIASGIQNYGYLPLPIIAELFSRDSGPMGLVFVHGMGVELAMWSIGLIILTGKANLKSLLNGPFIAVIIALILNFSGLFRYIPKPVDTAMEMLGQCAIPLSILMIGATMGRFFKRDILLDVWRVGFSCLLARMIIMAGIILLAAVYLPISQDLKQLLVIQAAMPAAVFPIVLARMYQGSPSVAIQVVLTTSAVSIISSPLLIAYGLKLIGS